MQRGTSEKTASVSCWLSWAGPRSRAHRRRRRCGEQTICLIEPQISAAVRVFGSVRHTVPACPAAVKSCTQNPGETVPSALAPDLDRRQHEPLQRACAGGDDLEILG